MAKQLNSKKRKSTTDRVIEKLIQVVKARGYEARRNGRTGLIVTLPETTTEPPTR